jgi:hypothetical protein
VPFLSDEWCDLYRELVTGIDVAGATATIETAVRRNDGELRSWTAKVVDGVVEAIICGPDPDADMRIEFAVQEDCARLLRGDTRPVYNGYWSGNLTVTGELDAVVAVAPLMDAPAYKAQLRRVHDQTDFG